MLWASKIFLQHHAVYLAEGGDIGAGDVFVDLMHGLADQAELRHRAMVLDETRVRGATGGAQLGRASSDLLDGCG